MIAVFAIGVTTGVFYVSMRSNDRWTDGALVATFRAAYLEGDEGKRSPIFFYIVENRTDTDYLAQDDSAVRMLVRQDGVLDSSWLKGVATDFPIFIPAGEKVSVPVHFRMIESDQPAAEHEQAFLRDPARTWNGFDAFVLLDHRFRYRVHFPLPWRATATPGNTRRAPRGSAPASSEQPLDRDYRALIPIINGRVRKIDYLALSEIRRDLLEIRLRRAADAGDAVAVQALKDTAEWREEVSAR